MNTDNLQISPILFDSLSNSPLSFIGYTFPLTRQQKLDMILQFDKAVQHILELGQEEHSSDWDPYYEIETINATYQTESGYSQITSYDEHQIIFLNGDEDGNEIEYPLFIDNILSIKVMR